MFNIKIKMSIEDARNLAINQICITENANTMRFDELAKMPDYEFSKLYYSYFKYDYRDNFNV
jgi:hypothetical protein